jgi:triacylglycerol lipase
MRTSTPRPAPATSRAAVAAVAVALLAAVVPAAAVAAAEDEPELSVDEETLDAALECPDELVSEHDPVLLVHGTGPTPRENFGWNLLPQLDADGYDVCTVELPSRALGDIQVASEFVVHAVRAIHARTGGQVDVAGHSQGGLEPRWAMAWWPSIRPMVGDLVTFASPHHGTVVTDVACVASRCWPAVHQMRPGSAFLTALHAQEDLSEVDVTSLGSVMDELVQPPETIVLEGASNIILQDVCPARPVTHLSIVADALAYGLLMDAFDHDGGADPERLPDDICLQTTIDEAGPEDLLTLDMLFGFLDGTALDPDVPRSLLTEEEPPLAPYAAAAAGDEEAEGSEPEPDGVDDPDADAPGEDETVEEPAGDPADGATLGAADGPEMEPAAASGAPTLPATGSPAAALGLALLGLAAVAGRVSARR